MSPESCSMQCSLWKQLSFSPNDLVCILNPSGQITATVVSCLLVWRWGGGGDRQGRVIALPTSSLVWLCFPQIPSNSVCAFSCSFQSAQLSLALILESSFQQLFLLPAWQAEEAKCCLPGLCRELPGCGAAVPAQVEWSSVGHLHTPPLGLLFCNLLCLPCPS